MGSDTLRLEVEDNVARLVMSRSEKMNAFTHAMLIEWAEIVRGTYDRDDVRVVVLTGAGRAFSAGGDVSGFGDVAESTPSEIKREVAPMQALTTALHDCPKPTIAAINGFAIGGGLDIALACDMRIAAEDARLAETYVRMGLVPGGGGAYLLPKIVGRARALELLLTADFITGAEAAEIGLVNRAVPGDEVDAVAMGLASRIAAHPPLSVQAIKRMVRQGEGQTLSLGLELASSTLAIVRKTKDHARAVQAFKSKTHAEFFGT